MPRKGLEEEMDKARRQALKDGRPTGPREQTTWVYATWLPDREVVRVEFRTQLREARIPTPRASSRSGRTTPARHPPAREGIAPPPRDPARHLVRNRPGGGLRNLKGRESRPLRSREPCGPSSRSSPLPARLPAEVQCLLDRTQPVRHLQLRRCRRSCHAAIPSRSQVERHRTERHRTCKFVLVVVDEHDLIDQAGH